MRGVEHQQDPEKRSTCQVNATTRLFEVEAVTLARPRDGGPKPVVEASENDVTGLAGAALWFRGALQR